MAIEAYRLQQERKNTIAEVGVKYDGLWDSMVIHRLANKGILDDNLTNMAPKIAMRLEGLSVAEFGSA
jgi:hypothetical protein